MTPYYSCKFECIIKMYPSTSSWRPHVIRDGKQQGVQKSQTFLGFIEFNFFGGFIGFSGFYYFYFFNCIREAHVTTVPLLLVDTVLPWVVSHEIFQ